MSWSHDNLEEQPGLDAAQAAELTRKSPITWLDVQGLGDTALLEELGEQFSLHPLTLEDVVNVPQRAKLEDYDSYWFLIARLPRPDGETEQLSMYIGETWVITIQEKPGDCFEPVRERIRAGRPRLRQRGPTYLAYALIDTLVDSWFPLVEALREKADALEAEVLASPSPELAGRIHAIKHEIAARRREVWPMREVLAGLLREDSGLESENRPFLLDCQDHLQRVIEALEGSADAATSLFDLNLSLTGHRMNEVMRVLTIIATIFIPLSFVAGLYGMNFDPSVSRWNMPELGARYGYPAALAVMATAAGGMLLWFRHKGWFR
jgi:magnesium transporter